MIHRILSLTLLASVGLLRSQTVAASASRSVAVTPSEVTFTVEVQAGGTDSLAEVVGRLALAGIQPEDLVARSVTATNAFEQKLRFSFSRPVSRLVETQAALRAIENLRRELALVFSSVTGLSQADLKRVRAAVLPELFAVAKARAETMLIEAGYRPGALVEVGDSVTVRDGGVVEISLALRMSRLGASRVAETSVTTVMTEAASSLRPTGPPRVLAAYRITGAGERAELFRQLAAAGVTEADLVGTDAEPDTFNQIRERPAQPVALTYRFSLPATESSYAARLMKLPASFDANLSVEFPLERPKVNPVAFLGDARQQAAQLAALLGSGKELGDLVGAREEQVPAAGSFILVARTGDFSFLTGGKVIPAARISVVPFFSNFPTPPPAKLRYRFAVR